MGTSNWDGGITNLNLSHEKQPGNILKALLAENLSDDLKHEVNTKLLFLRQLLYFEEVFDLRVVVSLLLNQRGAVQLTRAEPDVRLHVGQLVGQDVTDHLHWHPVARHLLPHPESPEGKQLQVGSSYLEATVLRVQQPN